MSKSTAIINKLKTVTTKKITLNEKPSNDHNCIVLLDVSNQPYHVATGLNGSRDRFQLDVWGDTLDEARSLADVVIGAMDNQILDGYDAMWLINDLPIKDIELKIWRVLLEFYVW
jgi:hypothetical protein